MCGNNNTARGPNPSAADIGEDARQASESSASADF